MTFGPVVTSRHFAPTDLSMLAAHATPSAPVAVPQPPISGSTTRTRDTLELDPDLDLALDASFLAKPEDAMLRMRTSRSDISSAKLKLYHEHCNKRLDHTLHLFRLREERERIAISRGAKKQRVGSVEHAASTATVESRDRQWKLIRESNDVRVYRHIRRKQRTSTVMASGTIHGSLSDVMNGLYADTTHDSQVLHTLLSSKFIDAHVLHVDRRTDDHEPFQFSGITWTALKTPGLFFCKNRDLLCFKKMDCFKDDYGDEFGYLVLQSIDATDACAKAIASKASRYVRGYISIAVLFKKQDDDLVSMYMHGEFNPKGRISSAFGDACFANSIVALANTAQSGQAKNLSMLLHSFSAAPSPPTQLFGPKAGKDRCSVCARSMFFWDAPQHCRGCWQRTCRSCRVKKPIFCAQLHRSHHGAMASKPQAPCTESFCLQCVASVVPSGVQTKAKLLQQLEKKRKRSTGSTHRPTMSSSMTDSSAIRGGAVFAHQQHLHASLAVPDDHSSISAASFNESEKHQALRLSLTRASKTPRARPASMVDVVERFETAQQRAPYHRPLVSGAASSSMPSLISFSSNDAGTISDYDGASGTGVAPATRAAEASAVAHHRDGGDYRVGTRQYHMDVLAAGLKRDSIGAVTGGTGSSSKRRTDEYYHKVLQRYLRSNRSHISVNSNFSSAFTNASSHHALTDHEDVSTVRSVVDSVSTGSGASIATADLYFKRL